MTKQISLIYTIILFAFMSLNMKAQTFNIDSTQISFDNKLRPCFSVFVDPDPKTLKSDWGSFLRKKYKIRVKGNSFFASSDLIKAEDVIIPSISSKRMDLYARITETPEGSEMKVFSAFGYDYFVGDESFEQEFNALKNLLNTFLTKSLNEYYTDEIKKVNKSIKSLNKENISLKRSISKNNDKMFKAQKDIPNSYVATKGITSEESIKQTEKLNKITETVNKLDNENTKSKLKIEEVEMQLEQGKTKLEVLKEKQRNLSNTTIKN